MPVSIAPAIRRKLRSITARDHKQLPELRWLSLVSEEMIESSLDCQHPHGRFWDLDSESECEDLGVAEAPDLVVLLPRLPEKTPVTEPGKTAGSSSKAPPVDFKESPSPTRVRAPLKGTWKGPLPSRRITLPATVGDYIRPALSKLGSLQRRDPNSMGFQNSNDTRLDPGPVESNRVPTPATPVEKDRTGTRQASTRAGYPKRRLVNPNLFVTAPLSFHDALMAGGAQG
jgi:hypothetical protein